MDDLKLEIAIDDESLDEILDFLRKNGLEYIKSERKGFDGVGVFVLLISGGVLNKFIDDLAKVIVSFIKRKEPRKLKINDVEIEGYSVEQIKELLDYAHDKDMI